jgi:hypothetical protein
MAYEICPECGASKHQLVACPLCGFTRMPRSAPCASDGSVLARAVRAASPAPRPGLAPTPVRVTTKRRMRRAAAPVAAD